MAYLLILRTRRHNLLPFEPVAKVMGYCDNQADAEKWVADTKAANPDRNYPSGPDYINLESVLCQPPSQSQPEASPSKTDARGLTQTPTAASPQRAK